MQKGIGGGIGRHKGMFQVLYKVRKVESKSNDIQQFAGKCSSVNRDVAKKLPEIDFP